MSLYYLAGYLLPTGLGLLVAPRLILKVLFSNGDYGDVMPRMAGAVIFALGILIVQIIRHSIDTLYPTAIVARLFLSACMIGLYIYSRDPFFLIVFAVIAVGIALTAIGYRLDRRQGPEARRP